MSTIYRINQILKSYAKKNWNFNNSLHRHFAAIFIEKKRHNSIISFGFNQMRNGKSIHAEMDAINNLPSKSKKRLVKVSLMVMRLNKDCVGMGNSKCCIKCCETIYRIPPLRGYTIENVYYSNGDGNIESHHPINLLLEESYHTTLFFTKKKYKPRLPNKIRNRLNKKDAYLMKK